MTTIEFLSIVLPLILACNANSIAFSGYNWTVKSGVGLGPGPNTWSEENVWIDSNGWMHLKISYDATNGKWLCASVSTTNDFGYGTYQWKIHGPVSDLDKNIVVGLFQYTGPDGYNEIDIEFARFGNESSPNINYSVYPAVSSSMKALHYRGDWKQCCGTSSTHRYTWTDEKVVSESMNGYYDDDTNIFFTNTFTSLQTAIPVDNMPVKMNLWCFRGLPPSDGKEVEIIILEFKFTPLS